MQCSLAHSPMAKSSFSRKDIWELTMGNVIFYVESTVHFGIKLYNDQRNAQIFRLFIYLLLPYMFRAFF
jgi:hypothetical protein